MFVPRRAQTPVGYGSTDLFQPQQVGQPSAAPSSAERTLCFIASFPVRQRTSLIGLVRARLGCAS
jgi:hypothetical protein